MNDSTLGLRFAGRVLRAAFASTLLTWAHALYAAPAGPGELVGADKPSPPTVEPASAPRPLPPPTPAEQRCGVQVVRVAVTAAGGLVELRFRILDAAKARERIMDPGSPPLLIPEGGEYSLQAPRQALRHLRFVDGVANYILYPNARSAVKPGTQVVVALAGQRLDPVTAE